MQRPESLGLVDERPLLALRKGLPLGAEPFRDLGVVHLWIFLRHLATLTSGPNHERVHRPLDPIRIVLVLLAALVPLDVVVVGWRWGVGTGVWRGGGANSSPPAAVCWVKQKTHVWSLVMQGVVWVAFVGTLANGSAQLHHALPL